jgi:hypothetical protein
MAIVLPGVIERIARRKATTWVDDGPHKAASSQRLEQDWMMAMHRLSKAQESQAIV